jgi:hypothetical protein
MGQRALWADTLGDPLPVKILECWSIRTRDGEWHLVYRVQSLRFPGAEWLAGEGDLARERTGE